MGTTTETIFATPESSLFSLTFSFFLARSCFLHFYWMRDCGKRRYPGLFGLRLEDSHSPTNLRRRHHHNVAGARRLRHQKLSVLENLLIVFNVVHQLDGQSLRRI